MKDLPLYDLVDSHFHVVDPAFPFSKNRGYRPKSDEFGTFSDFRRVAGAAGVRRAVAVQPSGYGYDNAALLDALRCSGWLLKGVVVLPLDTSLQRMQALARQGVIGVRMNLTDYDPEVMDDSCWGVFLENVRDADWWLEVQCRSTAWRVVGPHLKESRVKVLVDHLGFPDPTLGTNQQGFRSVLELGYMGTAAIKLSGLFRLTTTRDSYHQLLPYIDEAIEAFGPSRCVWGSDWPFVNFAGRRPHYAETMNTLSGLLRDDAIAEMIFRRNAVELFGFDTTVEDAL